MTNTYKATSKAAQAAFSSGVFEHEFTPSEEQDWLANGLLELVPRTYRVLTSTEVYGHGKDEEFEAAMLVEQEAALLSGGHIERVDKPAKKKEKEAK